MTTTRLLLGLLPGVAGAAATGAETGERKLPQLLGVTVEDDNPQGCVSCHILDKAIDKDVRLTTFIKYWIEETWPELLEKARASAPGLELIGRHPDVLEAVRIIPDDCLVCHAKDSTEAPPFATLIHLIHLTGGIDSTFVTTYQGNCTHCHALDVHTGRWSIKSGTESGPGASPGAAN